MGNHIHASGIAGIITLLYVIAGLGTINLLAMAAAGRSSLAASYCNLFGLSA